MNEPFNRKNTIFLIDGSSFLYRAFFGLPPLNTPDGLPIRVTFGFTRILKKFIDDFDPAYLAIVWDPQSEVSAWRKKIYPAYKAQRPPPPKEIDDQRALVKNVCSAVGIAQFEVADEEADDILYSLAKHFSAKRVSAKNYCLVIVTQDKDLHQCIRKRVVTYDPFKEYCLDFKGILARYHLPPKKLPFYYALVGDTSDNLPGVPGIGPHVASRLAGSFSSLTDLYKHLDTVGDERIVALLKEHKKNAFITQKLFRLKYHHFHQSIEALSFAKENWSRAYSLFEKWGFNSLLEKKGTDLTAF